MFHRHNTLQKWKYLTNEDKDNYVPGDLNPMAPLQSIWPFLVSITFVPLQNRTLIVLPSVGNWLLASYGNDVYNMYNIGHIVCFVVTAILASLHHLLYNYSA